MKYATRLVPSHKPVVVMRVSVSRETRTIAGFDQPTSGDVLLNGESVNHRKPYERNVSTVFQSYALFPHLTARGNVEFGLKRHGANASGTCTRG